jgi:dihydroxyacetone kinase-like predicted kinase
MQAALAALLAFDPARAADQNAEAVAEALARLRTGGIAPAARADAQGRFRRGDALGYVGETLHAWGDPTETLRATLAALCEGCELVTCIAGDGAPLSAEQVAGCVPDGVELDTQEGGQPAWWWLLCAE